MTIRVDGLTELRGTFADLPSAFVEVVSESIDQGTDTMWSEAFNRAPVGPARDPNSGKLKKSIGRNARPDGLQTAVGSSDPKAKFLEFGTGDTPAEPFLFPAFRIGSRQIRGEMRQWADDAGMRAKFKTKRGRKAKKK